MRVFCLKLYVYWEIFNEVDSYLWNKQHLLHNKLVRILNIHNGLGMNSTFPTVEVPQLSRFPLRPFLSWCCESRLFHMNVTLHIILEPIGQEIVVLVILSEDQMFLMDLHNYFWWMGSCKTSSFSSASRAGLLLGRDFFPAVNWGHEVESLSQSILWPNWIRGYFSAYVTGRGGRRSGMWGACVRWVSRGEGGGS